MFSLYDLFKYNSILQVVAPTFDLIFTLKYGIIKFLICTLKFQLNN